jgi:hypothetical protein
MSFLRLASFALPLALAGLGLVFAQDLGPNEHEVTTPPSRTDRTDVWTLDLRFKDPRIITARIPGRGTRICWYLWFQVINRTGKPREFQPIFELVSHDYPASFIDEPYPSVVDEIRRLEDPSNYLNIKSTYEIGKSLIPVSKPPEEAFATAVTGVAVWDASPGDPKKRVAGKRELADTMQFSIFIRGLSNGFVRVDPPAPGLPAQYRDKTLQLKFRRTGDRFSTDSRDMQYVPPAEWTYRSSNRTLKGEDKNGLPNLPGANAKQAP